ncbi:hypothetical protein [Burkholderia pseudomallei]|uniref:hypothetical protein n=1 Tax=Burkholderia pseudomallei TaxID=28450 RepID=UPI0013E90768|nr:hypothetical protein [Burkholderia pseudomallei]
MLTLWIRTIRDMQHEALVAMWMPMVDSASFMGWVQVEGFPAIAGCRATQDRNA